MLLLGLLAVSAPSIFFVVADIAVSSLPLTKFNLAPIFVCSLSDTVNSPKPGTKAPPRLPRQASQHSMAPIRLSARL